MNKKFLKTKKGFTLIELVVVTAIFGILSSILLFNYGDFSDRVLSTNMAYEIALIARQAQVFGLGVRGSNGDFNSPYGIFVHIGDEGSNSLAFFKDDGVSGSNQLCDGSGGGYCTCSGLGGDECVEQLTLQKGITIESVSGKTGGVNGDCESITDLSVSFKRPNPDAIIKNHASLGTSYEFAEINIRAPRSNELRHVIIRSTGQISVSNKSACN